MDDFVKVVLGGVAFLAVMLFVAVKGDEVGCVERWKDSGLKHDWSIHGGCRVEDKNGRLVPEKVIHDIR